MAIKAVSCLFPAVLHVHALNISWFKFICSFCRTLAVLNLLDPLFRDQKFGNTMKTYLQEFVTVTEYINSTLAKLQGMDKPRAKLCNMLEKKVPWICGMAKARISTEIRIRICVSALSAVYSKTRINKYM